MKLLLVSIQIHGKKYARFVRVETARLTTEQLHAVFPELKRLVRGETYSIG